MYRYACGDGQLKKDVYMIYPSEERRAVMNFCIHFTHLALEGQCPAARSRFRTLCPRSQFRILFRSKIHCIASSHFTCTVYAI